MQSHGKNETFSYVTVSKTSQDYQFSYNKMQKYQNDQKSKFIEAEDQPNHINEGNKLKQWQSHKKFIKSWENDTINKALGVQIRVTAKL